MIIEEISAGGDLELLFESPTLDITNLIVFHEGIGIWDISSIGGNAVTLGHPKSDIDSNSSFIGPTTAYAVYANFDDDGDSLPIVDTFSFMADAKFQWQVIDIPDNTPYNINHDMTTRYVTESFSNTETDINNLVMSDPITNKCVALDVKPNSSGLNGRRNDILINDSSSAPFGFVMELDLYGMVDSATRVLTSNFFITNFTRAYTEPLP